MWNTFVEAEEVDISKVQTEIETLEKELAAVQNEMKNIWRNWEFNSIEFDGIKNGK